MQPELSFQLGSRLVAVGAYPLFISLAILTVVLAAYLVAVRRNPLPRAARIQNAVLSVAHGRCLCGRRQAV